MRRIPDAAQGSVDVRVSSNGVDYSKTSASYEYVDAHHVHDVLPRSGSTNGGTIVYVSGTGFKNTSNLYCRFGTLSAVHGVYISSTNVSCVSPMYQIGTISVEVTTNGVDYSEDMVQYRYYASPAISHIVPSSGPTEGGTVVSVYGRNFIDSDSLYCRFGNDSTVAGRWVSSDRVECQTSSMVASNVVVEVTNNGFDYTANRVEFTVLPESVVTIMDPTFGPIGTSTSVTVHGSGFVFSRSLYCRFGLLSVAAMFVNDTMLIVVHQMQHKDLLMFVLVQ